MENKSEKPGYLFQLAYELGSGKNLSVSGNFMSGSQAGDMVVEMDKVMDAMDFIRMKRLELPSAEGSLADQKLRLTAMRDEMAKLSEKERRNTAESAQLQNVMTNIERTVENVMAGEEFLADLRQKVKAGA